jgi:DnaD/phage-associated family protein
VGRGRVGLPAGRQGAPSSGQAGPRRRPPPLPADGEGAGFPTSALATPVPSLFFSRLLPALESPAELVVTLYFFYAQTLRRRSPPFVTRRELAADAALARTLSNLCAVPASGQVEGDALGRGLALAVERGSLLRVEAKGDGRGEELYLLATPFNRRAAEGMEGAEMRLDEPLPPAEPAPPPNVFALYEENVGGITPLIADELKDAEERYPPQWMEAAFREAVSLNKRSWRYIHSILRRWEAEGPDYEEAGRDPEADWLERRYSQGKRGGKLR